MKGEIKMNYEKFEKRCQKWWESLSKEDKIDLMCDAFLDDTFTDADEMWNMLPLYNQLQIYNENNLNE